MIYPPLHSPEKTMKATVLCLSSGTQLHAQQIIALRHRLAGRSPCAINRPSIRERRRRQQQRGHSALPSLLPTTFKLVGWMPSYSLHGFFIYPGLLEHPQVLLIKCY